MSTATLTNNTLGQKLGLQDWPVTVDPTIMIFPRWAVKQAEGWLADWLPVFPQEETWVCQELGIPGLLLRFDCMAHAPKKLNVCEIDPRPGGAGVAGHVNSEFQTLFAEVKRDWPPITAVITHNRKPLPVLDDRLWTTVVEEQPGEDIQVPDDHKILVRAEPGESRFNQFISRSVGPVAKDGDKRYGVALGWWWEAVYNPFPPVSQLPWHMAFVAKPVQGSKCLGGQGGKLHIWYPGKYQPEGCSTQTQIEAEWRKQGVMFIQPYFPPMVCHLPGYGMMYRFFFGYSLLQKKYVALGGIWVARPNVKIHGAKDAICGPLVVGK